MEASEFYSTINLIKVKIGSDPTVINEIQATISQLTDLQFFHQQRSVGELLKSVFRRHNWGRRVSLAFYMLLLDQINNRYNIPEPVFDELGDFFDAFVGHCTLPGILRFPKDPDDILLFEKYLSSRKWLDEDFYSGNC